MEPQSELLQPDDELFTELFSVLNDDDRKKKVFMKLLKLLLALALFLFRNKNVKSREYSTRSLWIRQLSMHPYPQLLKTNTKLQLLLENYG